MLMYKQCLRTPGCQGLSRIDFMPIETLLGTPKSITYSILEKIVHKVNSRFRRYIAVKRNNNKNGYFKKWPISRLLLVGNACTIPQIKGNEIRNTFCNRLHVRICF